MRYLIAADAILLTHALFVAFIVLGLLLIFLGRLRDWSWVRNFWFRVAHLGAIALAAGEALLGVWCPLTIWEARLRGTDAEKSFIAQWVHRVLFYDFPEWVFALLHVGFALIVAATWWWIRCRCSFRSTASPTGVARRSIH